MPTQIVLDEEEVAGFSVPARDELQGAAANYLTAVIAEANRIEATHNLGNGQPEVTRTMVSDAVRYRNAGTKAKPRWPARSAAVAASVAGLFCGIFFDAEAFSNSGYLLTYFIGFTVFVCATIAAAFL